MGEGLIFDAQDLLADTLAACDEWQALTGTATAVDAKAHVYQGALPQPGNGAAKYTPAELSSLRPFAILGTRNVAGFNARRDATGMFRPSGALDLYFEMDTPAGTKDNWPQLEEDTVSIIGRLIVRPDSKPASWQGLLNLAHQSGYLAIETLRYSGPFRAPQEDWPGDGDYLSWFFEIEYGTP